MSSISDIISKTAAANGTVGGAVAAGSVQAGILSTLNGSSDSGLFNLIAAANSEAALAPAAMYTPSAELTAAINAASTGAPTSPFGTPAVAAATEQAGTEAQLLQNLGGSFNGIA